jgi:hypothetical protein
MLQLYILAYEAMHNSDVNFRKTELNHAMQIKNSNNKVPRKGSSPDPAAPVLPGVCYAPNCMIPPLGMATLLSRTPVPLSIIDKPVSIPYSSVKDSLHLSEKKRNSSISFKVWTINGSALQSWKKCKVCYIPHPKNKKRGEKVNLWHHRECSAPTSNSHRAKSKYFICYEHPIARLSKIQMHLDVLPRGFLKRGKALPFLLHQHKNFNRVHTPYTAKRQQSWTYIAILGEKKSGIFFPIRLRCRAKSEEEQHGQKNTLVVP